MSKQNETNISTFIVFVVEQIYIVVGFCEHREVVGEDTWKTKGLGGRKVKGIKG